MNRLSIYLPNLGSIEQCQWTLSAGPQGAISGSGSLLELPPLARAARSTRLILAATQVLLTQAQIPDSAKRRTGALLSFAVEDKTASDPEAIQVTWLGKSNEQSALAVIDKSGLEQIQQTLGTVGIRLDAMHDETLLLPIQPGEWSIAWNGHEGFVRCGEFAGAVMDCGNHETPPLALQLMLDEARLASAVPTTLAIYSTRPNSLPNLANWQRTLGTALRDAGPWDWRRSALDTAINLLQPPHARQILTDAAKRLRPAAWIFGAALALHGTALVIDWARLSSDQRSLRQQMETQFRATFPAAVAVADPVLQMSRKLAVERHAAGLPDKGDFLPLLAQVATAIQELPKGALRSMAYDSNQLTLELATSDEAALRRIVSRLRSSGLTVIDTVPTVLRVHAP